MITNFLEKILYLNSVILIKVFSEDPGQILRKKTYTDVQILGYPDQISLNVLTLYSFERIETLDPDPSKLAGSGSATLQLVQPAHCFKLFIADDAYWMDQKSC